MDDADKLQLLKRSNDELAEAIRSGEGTDEELRVMFEAYQDNLDIIDKLETSAS